MRRKCTDSLIYWKKNPGRKPLILQGLRQTGKTWLLMDFGNKQYEHTLYINLETDRSATDYLSVPHDPQIPVRLSRGLPDRYFFVFIKIQKSLNVRDKVQ